MAFVRVRDNFGMVVLIGDLRHWHHFTFPSHLRRSELTTDIRTSYLGKDTNSGYDQAYSVGHSQGITRAMVYIYPQLRNRDSVKTSEYSTD